MFYSMDSSIITPSFLPSILLGNFEVIELVSCKGGLGWNLKGLLYICGVNSGSVLDVHSGHLVHQRLRSGFQHILQNQTDCPDVPLRVAHFDTE